MGVYTTAFNKTFLDGEEPVLSIVDFAVKWCGITPTLAQSVMLKIYSGEPLSEERVVPYSLSEREWFDLMYDRGRFPSDAKSRIKARENRGFENIILILGRRAGKSTLVAIAALYTVYKVLQHHNPQEYYSIQEGSIIEISVAAKTGQQAKKAPFAKIKEICDDAIVKNSP